MTTRTLLRIPLLCAVLSALAFVYPTRGYAEGSQRAREKAAKKACAAGDFRKGVEILASLFVDTDDPGYVYNQGRCYEQNHQWVGAIDRFREYLRKTANRNDPYKAETEKHIADCEGYRQQEESKQLAIVRPADPAPPPAPAPAFPVAPVYLLPQLAGPPGPVANTPAVELAPPPERAGSAMRVTGVVVGSVGLAAMLTGLILNIEANHLADDFNRTQSHATQSSQSSYKTGSMIGYAVGAGVLVTGVVLYLVGGARRTF